VALFPKWKANLLKIFAHGLDLLLTKWKGLHSCFEFVKPPLALMPASFQALMQVSIAAIYRLTAIQAVNQDVKQQPKIQKSTIKEMNFLSSLSWSKGLRQSFASKT